MAVWNLYRRWWRQLEECRPVVAYSVVFGCGILGYMLGVVVSLVQGHRHPVDVAGLPWLALGLLIGIGVRAYARSDARKGSSAEDPH